MLFRSYHAARPGTSADVWALPLTPPSGAALKPSLILQAASYEGAAQFSPDGRWILYASDESRQMEIYVAPFALTSVPAGKRQISVAGAIVLAGGAPRWQPGGREVIYVAPDRRLMATEIVTRGDTLEVGATRPLFGLLSPQNATFDVAMDGRRFLVLAAPEPNAVPPITLVQNWVSAAN